MKMIKITLLTIVLVMSQIVFGAYSSEYRWLNVGASGQLQYKDGSALSASNRAVYISTVSGDITAPLTNNVGVGDGDNILSEGVQSSHQVGGTKQKPNGIPLGPGKIWATSGSIGTPSKGFVRFFSTNAIEDSVYYGNSDVWDYSDPIPTLREGQTLQTSIINPAYMIALDDEPNTNAGMYRIDGKVANIGSDNNQIPNDYLDIDYKITSESSWSINPNVATDGAFSITGLAVGEYLVKVRVKDDQTLRPNFPCSVEFSVVVIPEPAFIGMLIIVLFSFYLKK